MHCEKSRSREQELGSVTTTKASNVGIADNVSRQLPTSATPLQAGLPAHVERYSELNSAAVEFNNKQLQHDGCLIVTDESPPDEVHHRDATDTLNWTSLSANPDLDRISVPSKPGDLSIATSEGCPSLDSSTPYPSEACSDTDSDNPRRSKIRESEKDLIDTQAANTEESSAPQGGSKRRGSTRRGQAPTILSWQEDALEKSEIARTIPHLPQSDISDFGERGFWANYNANGRKTTSFPIDENTAHLALQDKFFEALERPHEEKKGFFPRALLSSMVTKECVFEELSKVLGDNHSPEKLEAYAEKICKEEPQPTVEDDSRPPKIKSFKKIFVILVMIEKTSSIIKFLEDDINDLDLPLNKVEKRRRAPELRASRVQNQTLECLRNWSRFKVESFEEWQWTTISPFFHRGTRKDVQHFPLRDSHALPFTYDSRRTSDGQYRTEIEGGYGRVFQVALHPDHHNFDIPYEDDVKFAIKRLNSRSRDDFEKEVEMLKMFSDNAHPHLISLLATYEQFGVYYLIFQWADGDLNYFWSTLKPKPVFNQMVKWVVKQCEGIAHGVANIHRYHTSHSDNPDAYPEDRFGRHGDIKPENILWFSDDDGGMLKIIDFGLAEYSNKISRFYKPKSRVATSPSYRPPECDLKEGKIGQSYDIWTLGCLYLEFVTWLLGGWQLVRTFQKRRMSFDPMWYDMRTDTFFELVECPEKRRHGVLAARVKKSVKEFVQELHAHEKCSELLHDLLNMVEYDMLIVKPNQREERSRITGEEVHSRLVVMVNKCEAAEAYAFTPAPWRKEQGVFYNSDEVVEVDITDSVDLRRWKKFPAYDGSIQEAPRPQNLVVPSLPQRSA